MDYKISSNILNGLLIINIDKDIDDYYFIKLEEVILNQLRDQYVGGVILDYANVQVLDYGLVNKMIWLTKSIELMGIKSVVTGLKPEIVITLISLGFKDLDIITKLNLAQGVSYIQKQQNTPSPKLKDTTLNERDNIK